MKYFIIALGLYCALCASQKLWAQGANTPGLINNQELKRQDELERQRRQELRNQAPDIHFQSEPSAPLAYPEMETPCFIINKIVLSGNHSIKFSHYLEAVQNVQGRCLGADGINILMAKVQNSIIDDGFVTTRIAAEPQDLTTGVLTLTVIPGLIGEIMLSDDSGHHVFLPSAFPAAKGDILNIRDIEQGLENLKRVPTAEADIELLPGAKEGESNLVVRWSQSRPFRFSLSVDDSGLTSTGRYQGGATVSIDNIFGFSDLFYFNYNHSLEKNKPYRTNGYSLHYSIPWGYWSLALSNSNYNYYQEVAGYQKNYQYSGQSNNTSLELSRVIHRNAVSKTSVSLSAFANDSKNFIDNTEMAIQRRRMSGWEAGINHRRYIGPVTFDGELRWHRGTGAFGAIPAPEEYVDEGTSRPEILNLDLQVLYPFKLGGENLRYSGEWRQQWAFDKLVSRDRFSIGGRYTVRGYNGDMTLSADNGFIFRNELALDLGGTGQEVYAALDFGRVWGPFDEYLLGKSLSGAAVGYRGSFKGFNYEFFIAGPLHRPDYFPGDSLVTGFNIVWSF